MTEEDREIGRVVEGLTGKVRWFDPKLGYGFVEWNDGEKSIDVFVHYTAINMEGFKTLEAEQEVAFDLHEAVKGPMATNVRVF